MGNASTQIAFDTEEAETNRSYFVGLKLNKKTYHVVSKSFLGLGLLEARKTISNADSFTNCYPLNYPLNETRIGSFDFENCNHLYTQLIENNHVNKAINYPKRMQFIAYSGIYGPLQFFEVNNKPSEKTITEAVKKICSRPWKVLEQKYSEKENLKYLAYHCADATYISDLLFSGYQLSGQQLLISKEVNGHKLAWPLGALLYQLTNPKFIDH